MNPIRTSGTELEVGRCLAARATHAPHRANLRCLGLSVGIAIAIAALSLAACIPQERLPVDALEAQQTAENANAGYMLRLGYDRLIVACAFQLAKEGATKAAAMDACTIDFNFTASGMEAPSGGETGTGSTEGDSPTREAGDAQ